MREVKSFYCKVGSQKNFVHVTKCGNNKYRVATERQVGKKKERASAILFGAELRALARVCAAVE